MFLTYSSSGARIEIKCARFACVACITHTYCSLGKVYEVLGLGGVGHVNVLLWGHGCWGRNVRGG